MTKISSKKLSKEVSRGRKKKSTKKRRFIDDDKDDESQETPSKKQNDADVCKEEETDDPSLNGMDVVTAISHNVVLPTSKKACTTSAITIPNVLPSTSRLLETKSSVSIETVSTKPPLISTSKSNSFSSTSTPSSESPKIVRPNHIPMQLVSATAMATAKPSAYHRSISFHESTSFSHRSEPGKSGLFFAFKLQLL